MAPMAAVCLVLCAAFAHATGSAVGCELDQFALLQREALVLEPDDVPKSVIARAKMRLKANMSETELGKQYKAKVDTLKEMTEVYQQAKKRMEQAKREAREAKRLMKEEADRLAAEEAARVAKIEAERQAEIEKQRTAREAAIAKAEDVINGAVAGNQTSMLSGIPVTTLVNVLLALPSAVANDVFMNTVNEAVVDMQRHVQNFLNVTDRKTTMFVSAAQSASDAELAYSMAKFFHEAVYRLKSLHKQALLTSLNIKKVMPESLRKSLTPIMTQLSDNVVMLSVNASELAKGSLGDACDTVSQIMGNISDYDLKLNTVSEAMENTSAMMVPMMGRIMPVSNNVTMFVTSFMSIAKIETKGLQDAAHSIVTKVGPLVEDRVHCTWSRAHRRGGLGFAALVISSVVGWAAF